jgi:hypothetical protein
VILWYVSWCHSIDLKFLHIWSLFVAFKIMFLCWIFQFLHLGVVSLPLEWSWHWVPVRGSNERYFFLLVLHWQLKKELRILVKSLCQWSGTIAIFNIFMPNHQFHECLSESPVRSYCTSGAAESLIAQLDSQGKFTTSRRKNLKIWHQNKTLKSNKHAAYVEELQIYRLIPKNICANLLRLSLEVGHLQSGWHVSSLYFEISSITATISPHVTVGWNSAVKRTSKSSLLWDLRDKRFNIPTVLESLVATPRFET